MQLLLGIDLGTSYFKAGLFDRTGAMRGLGRVATVVENPEPGRVELPVKEFWARLGKAIRAALDQAGAQPADIAGFSYSSQANSFVLLDGNGGELTPLVLWNDRRAYPLEDELKHFGETVEHGRVTGLSNIAPERAPAKWRWFAREKPEVWTRARYAMTISDYLTFAVTGSRIGDAATASLTGLYDLQNAGWWPKALEVFGVQNGKLSQPFVPGSFGGCTNARAAALLGLPAGIPFAIGTLDHHAAALGSGIGLHADASISTGTVLAALVLVDEVIPAPGCIHGPHTDGKRFYRLAFDPAGAGQLEHYQKAQAPGLELEELFARAKRVSEGESVEHGAEMLGMLHGIAAAQQALLARVAGTTALHRVAATGGGARSPFWLQIKADRLGLPVVASDGVERACLGAALFAGVAAGYFSEVAGATRAMVRPSHEFSPKG